MILGISKIYQDFKTTIPKNVREKLDLEDGDEIIYEFQNGLVILSKNSDSKKNRFTHL